MDRKRVVSSVGGLVIAVLTLWTPAPALGWFNCGANSYYVPYCHSGNCGGGNHILECWGHHCHCGRNGAYNYGYKGTTGAGFTGIYWTPPNNKAPYYNGPVPRPPGSLLQY